MGKITPFLWFNNNVAEAMDFYTSVFKKSKVSNVSKGPDGQVMMASFTLEGQDFHALNGGPQFQFTEAVSFFIACETQAEVDYYWDRLQEGGGEGQCGWVKDRFGLWWQVIPNALGELMGDPNPAKAQAVSQAMLKMNKMIIADLKAAYDRA
jgi:predicted 3-demethylubiquinone-9 3-methyltransferase (glyoxalase superfamily)